MNDVAVICILVICQLYQKAHDLSAFIEMKCNTWQPRAVRLFRSINRNLLDCDMVGWSAVDKSRGVI